MFIDIGLTIVIPTLLVAAATLVIGRKRQAVADGERDADSLSFVGGVLAALFTVVLAFYIVFAWQTGADIESESAREADGLVAAYWQAETLADPEREQLQGLVVDYTARVTDVEWGRLAVGGTDEHTGELLRDLRSAFAALPTDDGPVQAAREQGLRDVRQIDEAHRARVDLATSDDNFNNVLLVVSLIGAAIMIVFPLLTGLRATPVNVAVMSILTAVIGITIYISMELAHPLSGPFAVEALAFSDALGELTAPSL